ncbi:MAG: primosomal protein N' [Treponema sp.]|nr:primosomal protein N' [Treponema sp.]
MIFLQIVLNIPVNKAFTYSYEPPENEKAELVPEIGKRAEIMFGNKKTSGFIISISESLPKDCEVEINKIRPVKRIIDKEPLFNEEMIEIAKWVSHYYLCTLGEAVFSMTPSARRDSGEAGFSFDEEIQYKKNILSEEQEKCVKEINENKTNLFHYLYGPTGTGKTEVFLQLAEQTLNKGKGVIYLVPEIALTAQVVKSIKMRFGDTAAIIHSGLTPSQKLTQWHKILHKEARVVIGARSAVFAPVPDLGLIIIDEEHDGSYKSGNNPRYHARQVAMHRCSMLKIPLLMGSATPSVEAWYMMQKNTLIKHTLTKRLAGGDFPKIKCINLNNFENSGCISKPLEQELNNVLLKKRQAILFLNRRGFTHFFRCNSCGFELKCKNCSIPMTYHKKENRLRCHYCNYQEVPPQICPQCSSVEIGSSGFGTEFIEAETKAKFPNAKVTRIDTDVMKNKEELLQTLEDFKNGKGDILLGTQMIAKGLNFKNLELVGVILADSSLHMPDFRAAERTFSLITQVAGRTGRYFPDGKVFIQTYDPDNEAIFYACSNRINDFYGSELQKREMLDFPPFTRLLRIVFRSFSKENVIKTAEQAAEILKKERTKGVDIIGPAECPIEKINSNYRYQILLKGESIIPLQAMARTLLFGYRHNPDTYIEYDVDPVSLL